MSNAKNAGEGVYQVMGKTKPQVRAPPVNRSNIRGVHLVPDVVACEGTTVVTIIFDEFPESSGGGKVEVSVRSNQKTDRITATSVNQRTFRFTAPENRAGEVPVMVFVGENDVASSHLRYRQESAQLVTGVAQIHLQLLAKLCRYLFVLQTKHGIPSPLPEIDQFMAEWFDDKDGANRIEPKIFEELFDILRHSPTDPIRSAHDLPTLLHLTAEFGLEKLAERLVDLPGAERAGQVLNAKGLTAMEIARTNGHRTLSDVLNRNTQIDGVVRRPTSTLSNRSLSKVETIMPKDAQQFIKSYQACKDNRDPDYVYPDCEEIEDNYGLFSPAKQTKSSTASKKPPPVPCGKSVQLSKSISNVGSTDSTDNYQVPRSSTAQSPPPLVPRRESRDSGAYVDGTEQTPPATAPRRNPPVSRGESEPIFVYGNTNVKTRLSKLSEQDIRFQLSKPVLPQTGSRGPSLTK